MVFNLRLAILFLVIVASRLTAGQFYWHSAFTVTSGGVNDARFWVNLHNTSAASVTYSVPRSSLVVLTNQGTLGVGSGSGNITGTIAAGGTSQIRFDAVRTGSLGNHTSLVNVQFSLSLNGLPAESKEATVLPDGSSIFTTTYAIYGSGFVAPTLDVAPPPPASGILRLRCDTDRPVWYQLGSMTPVTLSVGPAWIESSITGSGLLTIRADSANGAELYPPQTLNGQWGVVSIDLPPLIIPGQVIVSNVGLAALSYRILHPDGYNSGPLSVAAGGQVVTTVTPLQLVPAYGSQFQILAEPSGTVLATATVAGAQSGAGWTALATIGGLPSDTGEQGIFRLTIINNQNVAESGSVQLYLDGVAVGTPATYGLGTTTVERSILPPLTYGQEYEWRVGSTVLVRGWTPQQQYIDNLPQLPGWVAVDFYDFTAPNDPNEINNGDLPPVSDPGSPDFDGSTPDLTLPPAAGTPERLEYDTMRRAVRDALRDPVNLPSVGGQGDAPVSARGQRVGAGTGAALKEGFDAFVNTELTAPIFAQNPTYTFNFPIVGASTVNLALHPAVPMIRSVLAALLNVVIFFGMLATLRTAII